MPRAALDRKPTIAEDSRVRRIESLGINDTLSVAQRIDLTWGVDKATISGHKEMLRGSLGSQTHTVRKKFPNRSFMLETGEFLTGSGCLMLVAALTRSE